MNDRVKMWIVARLVMMTLLLGVSGTLWAAPGDVFFQDDFERASLGADWTVAASGGDAGIGTYTANSGTRSMYTRWGIVSVTSKAINLTGASTSIVHLSFWLRRGSDSFSEWPEAAGEDYQVQYLNSSGTWTTLAFFPTGSPQGEIFNPTIELPADALHAGFKLRFYQPGGSGSSGTGGAPGVQGYDYWHIDDVKIYEAPVSTYTGAFCDNFDAGIDRSFWSVTGAGSVVSSTTAQSGNSMALRWKAVSATTLSTNLSGVSGNISYWVRSGTTTAMDPDSGEDLVAEYYNSSGTWTALATYPGSAAAGTTYNASFAVPADAKHTGFRLRFRMLSGSGSDNDYWHVDDVCVGMAAPVSAACGPIPIISSGTGPVFAGTKIEVSSNVKVNNGSYVNVNSGDASTNKVVPTAGGAPSTVAATLPPLQPATFPSTSGSFSVPSNGSGSLTAPQYLNSLTVGNNSATLTLAPGDYYVNNLSIGNDAIIKISPAGKVRIFTDSNVTIGQNAIINNSPDTGDAGNFMLLFYGAVDLELKQNVNFVGVIYAPDNAFKAVIGKNSKIYGGIVTGGKVEIKDNVELFYTATIQAQLATASTCASSASLHHVRIGHTGSGVTCSGSSVTVYACNSADSGGSCTANTSGLSGNVTTSSGVSVPFTIAAGNSSATVTVPVTTAQTVTLGVSGLSVMPTSSATCWDGSSSSCSHVYSNAGFIFSSVANGAAVTIPAQVAGTSSSTYYLRAVKTNTTTKACEAALTNPTAIDFAYECNNPATCSASNLMSVNGGTATTIARNDNGAVTSYSSVNMAFDGNGNAPFSFNFGDVGAVTLYARKAAGGSLLTALAGATNSFVVAPASFAFSGITAGPIKAANNFSATVTALTSGGAATPNFGKETSPEGVTLSFTKYQPTGAGAVNGSFSGSVGAFSSGVATASNLNWSEVGTIDLVATLASGSYLGSGLTAVGTTGTTGAVGRFIPDHFDVTVTQGCSAGNFTYSGQPLAVKVTAKNGLSATTLNYDGSSNTSPNFAKAVTLSEANAVAGSLSPTGVAASAFAAGVANGTPAFSFTTPLTAPATIKLRAVDADSVSSATGVEGAAGIRSGRLRLFNAFGSENSNLNMSAQTQYWSGNSWILNANDSCTTIPAASIALSNYRDGNGAAATWTTTAGAVSLAGGQGVIVLAAPSPANSTGSVDVALNLGTTTMDNSCLASHPVMTAPAVSLAYLRGKNGNCTASDTYSADPSARATFGIYSPETRKAVHIRELY